MNFGRLITAMATPFEDDGEQIDRHRLSILIEHLLSSGTTTIIVAGTTGESPTLSHQEKLTLLEWTMEIVNHRVPVMLGAGTNDTKSSVALAREAESMGADGVLLVAPYYNRPNQEGLYAHFATIADAIQIPIMLYNVPTRTSSNIEPDTVLKLAQIPHVFALKEATSDMSQILRIAADKPDDFYLYSGDDKLTLPILSVGGYGVVSVASHLVGREMTQMIEAYVAGNIQEAARWSGMLLSLFEALFMSTSPGPLKWSLEAIGVLVGSTRLPVTMPPAQVCERLRKELLRLDYLQSS